MSEKLLNSEIFINNLVTIANFVELGSNVIVEISGNDISTKINEGDLNKVIRSLIVSKLSQKLAHYN